MTEEYIQLQVMCRKKRKMTFLAVVRNWQIVQG